MVEISCLPIKIEFFPLIRLLFPKQKAVSFVLPFRKAARINRRLRRLRLAGLRFPPYLRGRRRIPSRP